MDLQPLVATGAGAVIALAGTLLADVGRDRRQRGRDIDLVQRDTNVDFVLALTAAHAGLREVGESLAQDAERRAAVNRAVDDAGLYGARERLLMTATAPVVKAGETVFLRLIDIRDAVRGGAMTRSREYHDVYHPFAEALWQFRMAARRDFHQPAFAPEKVDRVSWSERESCSLCGTSAT